MSADFLVNYLVFFFFFFGPIRAACDEVERGAPSATNGARQRITQLTPDLITEAENLRLQLKDLP